MEDDPNQSSAKFTYYDTEAVESTIHKFHNQAINIRSVLALNKQNPQSDSIKSFDIITEYFDQSLIKTQVNMGQIKKI